MDLLFLLVAATAIVALFRARNAGTRIRRLEDRLFVLEQRSQATPGTAADRARAAPAEPEAPTAPIPPVMADEPVPETAPPPPLPPPFVPTSPAPAQPAASFEERFGTRWVVWVGGLALALGGVFLVRYSIEQDLIGPRLRLFIGALFAAGLVTAGEWARRHDRPGPLAALPSAYIPGILTAAGTLVAFATIYAAYALYGFLAPGIAFVLLGLVGLATLAAALLHGPALAGLGLVGSYVTPMLVASETPSFWALYIYLAVVTAAAFALARARLWRWLALTAVGFSFLWMLPGLASPSLPLEPLSFHVLAGFGLAAALIVAGLFAGPQVPPGKIDAVSSQALAVPLVAASMLVLVSLHDPLALGAFALLMVATVAIAWRSDAAAATLPVAALLVFVVIGDWALQAPLAQGLNPVLPIGEMIAEVFRTDGNAHLWIGAAFAALFGLTGFLAQGRSINPTVAILWSGTAVLAPVAILVALYYRLAGVDVSIPFAGVALVLAALYAWATEQLSRRAPAPGSAASTALFATGSVAALALAMTFALEKGWLTVALALMVPGVAWIALKRPLPMLRWLAAALTVLVVLRISWDPLIVGDQLGTTPILNWILYGYGVPALSFWVAGHLLRRRADDAPTRMVESGAILFTVLLVMLEIRHYMTGGDLYRAVPGLAEIALQVSASLAMAIGLEHVRARTGSTIHNVGAIMVAAGTLTLAVFGLAITENPMFTGDPVGEPFVNLVLLGYGVPAVLAIGLVLRTRDTRPIEYRAIAAVAAMVLALAYLSLEVRTLYHGPVLTEGPTTQVEQYTYSAVWLVFGVLLLIAGFFLRSQPARLASAAVLVLTSAKVFLLDMSALVGIYRALSFIGLGIVLVTIGLLYQKLLLSPGPSTPREENSWV